MSRLIDADALIDNTKTFRCIDCERRKGMKNGKLKFVYEIGDVPCRACDVADMIDTIDEAPTVDAAPVVHGRWTEQHVDYASDCAIDEIQTLKCSVCGLYHTTPYMYYVTHYKYCPNCGAKMDLEGR